MAHTGQQGKPMQTIRRQPQRSEAGRRADSITYGYARVSSRDQNLARQIDALRTFGIEPPRIYADKASGGDFQRPGYQRLMRRLKPGDTVVVKSIDRLGRNYDEILAEWQDITKRRRACIVVLDMPLRDTRNQHGDVTGEFIADLMLQLLSYVAHIERDNIRQRQAEGIAAARARGVRFGRPPIEQPDGFDGIRDAYLAHRISVQEASDACGVSQSTFRRWLRAFDRPEEANR